MVRMRTLLSTLLIIVLLGSCTSTKNTGGTRWYHSFNTRYNVYFNGEQAYLEAKKIQEEGYKENFSEMICMFPVSSLPKDKQTTGGPFDRSVEKAVKAIKTHSIQTKPEKKPGKSKDPKYQEFMNRTEYNPFLHNAWMLLGKSQFHNGDFLTAASTFSYTSRLYSSQPEIALEAKIWQARCYSELEWYYEADDLLSKINNEKLPKKDIDWFSTVYADYLIKQKRYSEAIPYMQSAIKAEKDSRQRSRMRYLLGQIYAFLGQREMAYQTFGEVPSASSPYIIEFSAKIRQTEVYPGGDTTKVTKQLRKMAKSFKNKDYLDQVYYALGNVYMSLPDTTKAIAAYEAGVEKSTQNGLDKALCQIQLGDIYFQLQEYVDAQPNYSEALGQLKKEDKDFARVSKRSEVLDELLIHFQAVELQDSLLNLSTKTPEEQMEVAKKIVADLIKKEEEEKKKAEREEFMVQQETRRSESNPNLMIPSRQVVNTAMPASASGEFYFYNPQAVSLGKTSFQQKWGRRKLEDDWRRRNKTNPMAEEFGDTEMDDMAADTIKSSALAEPGEALAPNSVVAEVSDPKDPQFYLQQIPRTHEEIEAANLIVADGLFNMAVIYKDKLEDYNLALATFDQLDTRYPDNENKLDAYYYTYLIYWKLGNTAMADLYKQKIRSEFPESDYGIAMADPDYEYNLKMMELVQDSIYQATYQYYLDGKIENIRKNYKLVSEKYTQSKLMPKFMFLNALGYAQQHDAEMFKNSLRELVAKYPEADVSVLASEMIKGFQRGLILSSSGSNMLARGSLFNLRFGEASDSLAVDSVGFKAELNSPHLLMLVYPKEEINENLLLFNVASFNFGNFMVSDFGLEQITVGEVGILQVKGFNNYEEIRQYVRMIHQPDGYAAALEKTVLIVLISVDNYSTLMRGKTMEEYMDFFEEHFGADNRSMIDQWKLKQMEELEEVEAQPLEAPADDQPLLEDEDNEWIEEIVPVVVEPEKKSDLEEVNEILNTVVDKADNINKALNDFSSDPIRSVQNLLKKEKDNEIDRYVKQQEKEEKERQKQLKKEKEAQAKLELQQAKEAEEAKEKLRKQQEEEEKRILKEKKKREEELKKLKKEQDKQAKAEKERVLKEKEDARKQKLKEAQLRQEQREKEQKEKVKLQNEKRKQREAELKAERERKEKERKAAQKAKEEERKAKQKK